MLKPAKRAILASVFIHIIAFMVFTGVKLYNREVGIQGKMPITFVKAQSEKPLRRSISVRQMAAISKIQRNPLQKQEIIKPTYKSSEVFYVDEPEMIFSILGNLNREGSKVQLIAQPPSVKMQYVLKPITIAIPKETPQEEMRLPTHTIDGKDFLKDFTSIQPKPDVRDHLHNFTQHISKETESRMVFMESAKQTTPGMQTIQVSEVLRVTGAANDPLRALQILPGITAPNSILAGLYVRGGGPDDNSYFFDRVYLSYPYHFIGLATTINSAAIKSVDVYAGGFGADFGNAQTVIDIHAKPPAKELSLTSNLNMLMSELMIESPIGNKASMYVAGRRSYADLIVPRIIDIPELTQFPMFWDYQIGLDYDLTPKQKLHFITFSTQDSFKVNVTEDFGQEEGDKVDPEYVGESHYITGFDTKAFTLNSSLGENSMLQSTFSHRRYTMDLNIGDGSFYFREKPRFYALREDLYYNIHPRHKIQLGILIESGVYKIATYFPRMPTPEEAAASEGEEFGPFNNFDNQYKIRSDISQRFTTAAGYFQDYMSITDWLDFRMGARIGYFNLTDEIVADPRLSLSFKAPNNTNIRAGWGIYHQNPTPAQILPKWGNPKVNASYGTHYVMEIEKSFMDNSSSIKLAGYYKDLKDLITKHYWDTFRNQGKGFAQGAEMLIKYNPSERFLGWLSYSYSLSRRKDKPDAVERLYIFDQTHVATISMSYKPTPNWELGARWSYTSGTPIDPNKEKISELRKPATHRLDLRFARTLNIGKNPLQFYMDVLNAYNYKSSVSVSSEAQEYINYESEDVVVPVIPYMGISMKF